MRMILTMALCGFAVLVSPNGSMAQQAVQQGFSGADVRAAAAQIFPEVQLTEDPYGDPMIIAGSRLKPFLIAFYGCDNRASERCQILRFLTYETGPFTQDKLSQLNAFNNESMFGRAMIDEDRDMAFDWVLSVNGATQDYLRQQMRLWEGVVLKKFVQDVLGGQFQPQQQMPQGTRRPRLEAFLPEDLEFVEEGNLQGEKTAGLKSVFQAALEPPRP